MEMWMKDRQPWFDLHDGSLEEPGVAVLGLPFDGGVGFRPGAAEAPARLREISRTSDALNREGRPVEGLTLRDFGDVAAADGEGKPLSQADYLEAARRRLKELPGDAFTLALGGDNSVSIPCIQSFAARHGSDAGILWFDAHADLFASYDGNPDSHACALRRALDLTGIAPERAVLLATRSFSREEERFIRERRVELITAAEWGRSGPGEVAARAAGRLEGATAVYLAVDIDGFDASCAPGTGYPMPGGVAGEPFFAALGELFRLLPIRSMDLTEVAPPLDHNDLTSFLAVQVVLEALAALSANQP
jgi:agmatinase